MRFIKIDARERRALNQAIMKFIPILLVLIILFSVVISYGYFEGKKQMIYAQQQSEIVTAMIDYRDNISYMTAIVRTIDADYLELAAKNASDADFQALFMENMVKYPIIDKLRILDINGMEILRLNQGDGTPYMVADEDLQDKSARYFYLETRALSRHQFLFSALDLNIDNGVIDVNPLTGKAKPTLRISSPVDIDEQRLGYLVVNFLMREYLDTLRTSLRRPGCYVLMMDENGYLFNDEDDANNFGFCYDPDSEQYSRTVHSFIPGIDLTADSRSLIVKNKICSYAAYTIIYDRSKDYFLSETSTDKLIFLVYYDNHSEHKNDLHYAYFYHLIVSWKMQLLSLAGLVVLYLLMIRLIFYYDRIRFTDLFSDSHYTKKALKQAISHHQFVNYYQPIINIQDGSVLGIESLSRWNTHGQVLTPAMFMDDILHYQFGQMLDENAFQLMRRDRKKMEEYPEFQNTFISINCCQQTFNSLMKDPPGTLIRLTEEEKKYVVLELVENIIFNQSTQERIQDMYKHNILFAIDDFGTGNSNVAFIRSLENLKIKIDRTFVPVNLENKKERIIIEYFVKMFIDLGLRLIVEGVETREQCRYLRDLGISGVQGFYFSKPMPVEELIEFMQRKGYLDKL